MNQRIKTIIITTIIVVALTGMIVYLVLEGSKEMKMKIDYPLVWDVSGQTSFSCESLMSAGIIGSPKDYLTNGVEGEVKKGTDKVAIKIKDEKTLSFITGAAVEAGVAEGDPFVILRNTDYDLVAIYYDEIWGSLNTFSLNKRNGLAVWSKTKPEFIGYESPSGDVIYLICR